MNNAFIQGFRDELEKNAYRFYNIVKNDIEEFKRDLQNLNPLGKERVKRGLKYVGDAVNIDNIFPGVEIVKSKGLGKGKHYRVKSGPYKGIHLIVSKNAKGKMKIKVHKDKYSPTDVKGAIKHFVEEGIPAWMSLKREQKRKKMKGRKYG